VAGGFTLAGVMVTQRSSRQQQAAALRVQESRDKASQIEARRYRNHDLRINAAAQYIAALSAFRRAVNDLSRDDSASVGRARTAARASADAGALVELYFSTSVRERSTAASQAVVDMHLRRLEGRDLGDLDSVAKAARDELIIAMKRQLGESEDHES
jgi:hypothetical protein